MANVSFLRGTQSSLETLLAKKSGYTEGAFYLTTDSDRLYFAQSSTELVHLNHNVIHVANIAALPAIADATVGDFYYAIAENVLCTKSASSSSWVQINKNTNTDNDTKVVGVEDVTVTPSASGITVSFDIKQTTTDIDGDETALADIPVSFTIKSSDIATANNINVGVATSAVTNGVKVATSGDGASGAGFEVTAGDNITISRDTSGNVTVAAKDTTYGISAADNKIILTNSDTDEDTIAVSSGNDAISATAAADQIVITHKDYGSKTAVSSDATAAPGHEGSFTVVDSITTDKGHVTAYNIKTVTLPKDKDTTSSLSVEAGNIIKLSETNGDSTEVAFTAGNADIVVTADTDADKIDIAHKVYGAPEVTGAEDVAPNHGGSFTVVDSIIASNGHITGYKTKQVTLPADANTKVKTVASTANDEGKLIVTVTDTNGDDYVGTSEQVLYYTVNGQKVYNQGTIDFYTKDEIDNMVESVNAMVYKGTVASNLTTETTSAKKALPASGVSIGDTYKVAYADTYGGYACEVGDLLIATGTETDGVITSGLTWTYVPSGDDTDSQYELNVANNTITLKNTVTKDDVGTATIIAGNDINVSTSGRNITVKHEDFTTTKNTTDATAAPKAGETVTVLDSITTDNGHITGYTNKVITLPVDKDTTSSLSVESGNVIRLTESSDDYTDVTLAAGNDYISLASDTDADKITISHKSYSTSLNGTSAGDPVNLSRGDNFTVVTGVERDAGGHLSKFTTQNFVLPGDNDTTSSIGVEAGNVIKLTETNGDSSSVTLVAGTQMSLTPDSAADSITINHATISTSGGTVAAENPEHGGSFVVLDSIATSNGHVTSYKTKTINLPTLPEDKDTTYSLAGITSAANNVATYTATLSGSNDDEESAVFKLTSSSLKVAMSDGAVAMNLEWGSF